MSGWWLPTGYNALVFAIYAWDKLCARLNWWRVPEARLLFLATVYGGGGALAGVYLLRHKRRKAWFAVGVPVMAGVQAAIAVVTTYLGWWA